MNKSSLSVLAKAVASKRGLTQAEAERFIATMFEVAGDGIQEDVVLLSEDFGDVTNGPVRVHLLGEVKHRREGGAERGHLGSPY